MRRLSLLPLLLLASLSLSATAHARVRAHFTAAKHDLPGALTRTFAAAERRASEGRPASIDIAVFSFTHMGITDELLRIAAAQPTLQIRLILDLGQLSHSEGHVGPYIEDLQAARYADACTLRLPRATAAELATCARDLAARYAHTRFANVAIKYKWYDGYVWDQRLARPKLEHSRSLLMHRKVAIINGDVLVAGSFNWSPQAATSNYENLVVLSGTAERAVLATYRAEFDAMWADTANFKSGPDCRALRQVIWDRLRAANTP